MPPGGAAIYALGKLTLYNCTLINNTIISTLTTVAAAGGAIYGGALSEVRLFNTTFRSNMAR
jgi:hypothetical protein